MLLVQAREVYREGRTLLNLNTCDSPSTAVLTGGKHKNVPKLSPLDNVVSKGGNSKNREDILFDPT